MARKGSTKKAQDTRAAIMSAARGVFARHAYNSASIRMIAAEGGFGHAIIGYYFPTKAELFEAVAAEICAELYEAGMQWLAEAVPLGPEAGLRHFVDCTVRFRRQSPDVLRIIALNFSENRYGEIPGQHNLLTAVQGLRAELVRLARLDAPEDLVLRLTDGIMAVLFLHYLGAAESAAWIMGLSKNGAGYWQRVSDTVCGLFLPQVRLLFGEAEEARHITA